MRRGRRALEGLSGYRLLQDLHMSEGFVALEVGLTPSTGEGETRWYVLLPPGYPEGEIRIHPSREGGLKRTHPHQQWVDEAKVGLPWRSGHLCLARPGFTLGRFLEDEEPRDVDSKLRWNLERALAWLDALRSGTLRSEGDRFERPALPPLREEHNERVAFTESAETLEQWLPRVGRWGQVSMRRLPMKPFLFPTQFRGHRGNVIAEHTWGSAIQALNGGEVEGIWALAKAPPVLLPWHIPGTWSGLREACKSVGLDLSRVLSQAARGLRDGGPHPLMLGAPVPETVGGEPKQIHWWGVWLPPFSARSASGFRSTERALARRDWKRLFPNGRTVSWLRSESWHPDSIRSRGRLSALARPTLVLGLGALGSVVAELLTRGGSGELVVVDPDVVEIGNLVRHTALYPDVGTAKATVVGTRLQLVAPDAVIHPVIGRYPDLNQDDLERAHDCELILDCTGDDKVLHALSQRRMPRPVTFVSMSVGYGARRLYLYTARGDSFPFEAFCEQTQPWLDKEQEVIDREGGLGWDSIGCWHPHFPARGDQIALMSALAVKHLESTLDDVNAPALVVYEQSLDEEGALRVARVHAP